MKKTFTNSKIFIVAIIILLQSIGSNLSAQNKKWPTNNQSGTEEKNNTTDYIFIGCASALILAGIIAVASSASKKAKQKKMQISSALPDNNMDSITDPGNNTGTLTNDGIIQMTNDGYSSDIIINKIHQGINNFDLSSKAIARLNRQLVDREVIEEMMKSKNPPPK